MAEFFSSLDIFILPSLWEGFGLVILEAGLSGLPVIASRVDGIKEIITDNRDGLLFKPGDAEELADKIRFIIDNCGQANKLGNNLSATVKSKFSLSLMAKQYEDLYLLSL
jgi:glycosyltransferase involved in cell wall biosynthesis